MQLVEQHVIDRHDPRYAAIDAAAFAPKNLYNAALYEMRQAFVHEGRYISSNKLDKMMQSQEAYTHAHFIHMLCYEAELVDIIVKITEESYRSKASFLDRDPLPVRDSKDDTEYTFSGKRVKRGLYSASGKTYINADLKGAYNIVRKVAPDAFGSEGVEDGKGMVTSLVVHPVRVVVPRTKPRKARGQ